MEFTNNKQFTATGSDEVGPFTFKDGKITGMVYMVLFNNFYAQHRVGYNHLLLYGCVSQRLGTTEFTNMIG